MLGIFETLVVLKILGVSGTFELFVIETIWMLLQHLSSQLTVGTLVIPEILEMSGLLKELKILWVSEMFEKFATELISILPKLLSSAQMLGTLARLRILWML